MLFAVSNETRAKLQGSFSAGMTSNFIYLYYQDIVLPHWLSTQNQTLGYVKTDTAVQKRNGLSHLKRFFSPIQILSLSPAGLRFHLTSIIINSCCFLYANCPLQNPFHSIYWVLGSSLHNRHTNKYLELFGSEGDWYIVKLVFAWPPHRNREHKQFRKNK